MSESSRQIITLGTTPAISRTMRFARLAIDGVNRATRVHEYAAGKAVNAARAARTIDGAANVCCIAPAGGLRGTEFERLLDAERLTHALVATSAATRLVVTVLDDAARTATELIEETAPLSNDVGEQLLDGFAAIVSQSIGPTVGVLSGSLAPGLPADFYAKAIAGAAGATIILDASGEPLRRAIAARPTVIKVNADELAGLEKGETVRTAGAVAAQTGGWVIVTRGREPTLAVHARDGAFECSVPAVERVVSAIGSGDSFAGGLAAMLGQGVPMLEALRTASACATANVLSEDAARFDRATAQTLAERVRVTRV